MRGTVNSIAPRAVDTLVSAIRPAFHSKSFPHAPLGGRLCLRGRYIQRNRGSAASWMPATDAKDNCRPTLAAAKGFWISSTSSAAPKADGPSPSRPARGAASRAHCMITARRADGAPPAIRA